MGKQVELITALSFWGPVATKNQKETKLGYFLPKLVGLSHSFVSFMHTLLQLSFEHLDFAAELSFLQKKHTQKNVNQIPKAIMYILNKRPPWCSSLVPATKEAF